VKLISNLENVVQKAVIINSKFWHHPKMRWFTCSTLNWSKMCNEKFMLAWL